MKLKRKTIEWLPTSGKPNSTIKNKTVTEKRSTCVIEVLKLIDIVRVIHTVLKRSWTNNERSKMVPKFQRKQRRTKGKKSCGTLLQNLKSIEFVDEMKKAVEKSNRSIWPSTVRWYNFWVGKGSISGNVQRVDDVWIVLSFPFCIGVGSWSFSWKFVSDKRSAQSTVKLFRVWIESRGVMNTRARHDK